MPAPALTSEDQILAAARRILEERGPAALTMSAVATAVGVRGPSLYKRVHGREDLLRRVVEQVTDELVVTLAEAAATRSDPLERVRALATAFRGFAHARPSAYALLFSPERIDGATERSRRSSATLLDAVAAITDDGLPAARTIVAWAHGFIAMELSGAFRLGGDVEDAWTYGLDRVVRSVAR